MSSPKSTSTGADAALVCNGAADAQTVAQMRRELSRWLNDNLELDAERQNDILLAVNEALTNSAEFAYPDSPHGTMSMQAHLHTDGNLDVTVSDHGTWREVAPEDRCPTRGRGLQLMRALSDDISINRKPSGTTVHLRFSECLLSAEDGLANSA